MSSTKILIIFINVQLVPFMDYLLHVTLLDGLKEVLDERLHLGVQLLMTLGI
jgi:hypothetical protein